MTKRNKNHNNNARRAYGIAELAESLDVSSGFIRLEVQRGRLATLSVGRRVLVLATEVDRYLSTAARESA